MVFWQNVYPNLAILARVCLTHSASSVLVEGLYSVTGIIKNARRSSMAPYRLNNLCCVHDNMESFPNVE